MKNDNYDQLCHWLIMGINSLYKDDFALYDYSTGDSYVSERCLAFALGWHLKSFMDDICFQELFSDATIDAEYNRHKGQVKQDSNSILIVPDLIIHKRETDSNNIVAIEIKKRTTCCFLEEWNNIIEEETWKSWLKGGSAKREETQKDCNKLKELTAENKTYNYHYGFHIILGDDKTLVMVYNKGDFGSYFVVDNNTSNNSESDKE